MTDVAIAGAGIVGAACADACVRAGLSVTVFDPGVAGGGTTAAGMGHLTVMDASEAQFALTRHSVDLWNARAAEFPPDVEYSRCGTLWVAADEAEWNLVRFKHDASAARGMPTAILDSASLEAAEPNLRKGLAGALLVSGDSVIYPPCAARWLLRRANFVQKRVAAIFDGGVRLDDRTTVAAGHVVNAMGIAAPGLSPGIAIHPRKGHLLITDRYPGFVNHQLVELGYLHKAHASREDSVAFNVQPRTTGQVLIGSSRQLGRTAPEVEPRLLDLMLRRAIAYMPNLAGLSAIRAWTGFRPCTPDDLPFIGLAPGMRRTWIAAGHEGLGNTAALATGQLIADLIVGKPTAIPPEPYSPSRAMPNCDAH
jgi:glycine/D-amino acid oxidase-like deaminating enzyme